MSTPAPDHVPAKAAEAVLVKSEDMPEGSEQCAGYDFNNGVDFNKLLDAYYYTGFQAHNFGLAVKEVEKMVRGGRRTCAEVTDSPYPPPVAPPKQKRWV